MPSPRPLAVSPPSPQNQCGGEVHRAAGGRHGGSSPVHLWPWTSLTHTGRTTEPSRAQGSALRATRQMTLANHLTSMSSVSPSVPHLLNRSAHWLRGSRTLVSRPGPGLPQQARANLLCLKTLGCLRCETAFLSWKERNAENSNCFSGCYLAK